MKNTKGMSNILAGVLIAVVAVGGFVFYQANKELKPEDCGITGCGNALIENDGPELIDHSENFEQPEAVDPYDPLSESQSSQIPLLAQSEAEQLVASNWGVDFNPIEGNPPVVEIERMQGGAGMGDHYVVHVYISALDDSVSTIRRSGTAVYVNGTWVLSSNPAQSWKCHPGRGHQDFSTENCI